tara:strand:- start:971 stop:1117 length:147 start_codon:yes stop_codon:yes gene_type:complete
MAFVGYTNEGLKGQIAEIDRALLMIGFVVGAGAISRWIINFANSRFSK